MDDHEMEEAVRLEAEQYIPVPLDDLYLDYTLLSKDKNGLEVLAVAVPAQHRRFIPGALRHYWPGARINRDKFQLCGPSH